MLLKQESHQVILVNESGETILCFLLYESDDLSKAKEAFEKLQLTLTPLLAKGSVVLTEELLKEIILPKPLDPSLIALHLVEVMEHNPNGHPEWYAVIESLMDEEQSKISLPLANTFSRKDFLGKIKKQLNDFNPMNIFPASLFPVQATAAEESDESQSNEILKFLYQGFKSALKKPDTTQSNNWLLKAVEKGYLKSCMNLTLSGVDTNIKDMTSGDSALHIAVKQGNLTLVKLLLAFLADPTICNAKGETPLDVARSLKIKNESSIIQALETVTELREEASTYYKQNSVLQKPRNSSDTFLLSLDGGGLTLLLLSSVLSCMYLSKLQIECTHSPYIIVFVFFFHSFNTTACP